MAAKGSTSRLSREGLLDPGHLNYAPISSSSSRADSSYVGSLWSSLSNAATLSSISLTRQTRPETRLSITASTRNEVPQEPLDTLHCVLELLKEHAIPGPLLFRLQKEFLDEIGAGTFAQVLALSPHYEPEIERIFSSETLAHKCVSLSQLPYFSERNIKDGEALRLVAIKRARLHLPNLNRRSVSDQDDHSSPSTKTSNKSKENFQRQLTSVLREVQFLSKPFMNHKNIVKLVAWGLCLDTLEDPAAIEPVVPLLILERAEKNLYQAIDPATRCGDLDWDHGLRGLCLDVGRGLQAIHREGLIHGDLKLQNILLFPERKEGEQLTYIAKLCDFGSSRQDSANVTDRQDAARAGTPDWQPPADSNRVKSGSLQICDVYSFGWVVWCAATLQLEPLPWNRPAQDSFMPYDLEHGPNIPSDGLYRRAKQWIHEKRHLMGHAPEERRVLRILLKCFHEDEGHWTMEPWWLLDTKRYPLVNVVGEELTSLAGMTSWFGRFGHAVHKAFLPKQPGDGTPFYINRQASLYSLPSEIGNSFRHISETAERTTLNLKVLPKRIKSIAINDPLTQQKRLALKKLRWFLGTVCGLQIRRSQKNIQHTPENECHSLEVLAYLMLTINKKNRAFPSTSAARNRCRELDSIATRSAKMSLPDYASLQVFDGEWYHFRSDVRLYALARTRSHYPICCWRASLGILAGLTTTHPTSSVLGHINFKEYSVNTIAWLCQGQIGEHELSETDLSFVFNLRELQLESHYETLLLLLEKGCRIDRLMQEAKEEKTRFRVLLETTQQIATSERPSTHELIAHFCRQLVHVGTCSRFNASYRFFLTGRAISNQEGLPDLAGDTVQLHGDEYQHTALHEAISAHSYVAVAAILETQFDVNARDGHGRTPIQLACELSKHNGSQSLDPAPLHTNWAREASDCDHPCSALDGNMLSDILSLLQQDERSVWSVLDGEAMGDTAQQLPLGWKQISSATEASPFDAFVEKHTGSFTMHIPSFSFLNSQRLMLGFRNLPSYTYGLDPLRFLRRKAGTLSSPKSASDLIFTDDWYRSEIWDGQYDNRIKSSIVAKGKYDQPRAVLNIKAITSVLWIVLVRRYDNLLLCLIPFAIMAEAWNWNSFVKLFLSAFALVPINTMIRDSALDLVAVKSATGVRWAGDTGFFSVSPLTCSAELFMGVFLSISEQQFALNYLLFGSIITRMLLILGTCFLTFGLKHVDYYLNINVIGSQLHLMFFGAAISGVTSGIQSTDLYWEDTSLAQLQSPIAGILIIIYGLSLMFHFRTHVRLLDAEDSEYSPQHRHIAQLNTASAFVTFLASLATNGLCSYIFVNALDSSGLTSSAYFCSTFVPIVPQLGFIRSSLSNAWRGRLDRVTVQILGSTVCLVMFISPILNFVHPWYATQTPFTAFWSAGLAWVINAVLADGRVDYLRASMLTGMYIIMVLAVYVGPPPESVIEPPSFSPAAVS